MELHNLKPNPGAKHRTKRLGAGESSGLGKTSGKGNKGQKARSGSGTRVDFRDKFIVVNVGDLDDRFDAGATIDEASLREVGLVNGPCDKIKLLGDGEVEKSFTVAFDKVSATAKAKIEKAGGSVTDPAPKAASSEEA